jgi:1,4-alpha-glucan branching enzyme
MKINREYINHCLRRSTFLKLFWLAAFHFITLSSVAQSLPPDVCRIENGQLIFHIDLRWNDSVRAELRQTYDIDSALLAELFAGKRDFNVNGETWTAIHIEKFRVMLYKPVQKRSFLSSLFFKSIPSPSPPPPNSSASPGFATGEIKFGFNTFKRHSVEMLNENKVRFTLFGFPDAQTVYLSGSFNSWSTDRTKLEKTKNGWVIELELVPFKYYYKFIVDGHWLPDPENLQTEPDGVGGINSVLYVTNYTFKLNNYPNAQKVVLAGSFNGWNEKKSALQKTEEGWAIPVYIANGRHTYKYIVDGNWITDPDNPYIVENEHRTGNSVINIGKGTPFILKGFSNAQKVCLAGSFNGWNGNDIFMTKNDSGWFTEYYLNPGNHEYKFVVDGRWMPDPANPKTHGSGELTNSFLVYKPNYTFILDKYPTAQTVFVTGSFNGWIHHGFKMERRNNQWELDLFLPKGKHTYKFIVDGQWIHDSNNPAYESNRFKSYDSVLWIE